MKTWRRKRPWRFLDPRNWPILLISGCTPPSHLTHIRKSCKKHILSEVFRHNYIWIPPWYIQCLSSLLLLKWPLPFQNEVCQVNYGPEQCQQWEKLSESMRSRTELTGTRPSCALGTELVRSSNWISKFYLIAPSSNLHLHSQVWYVAALQGKDSSTKSTVWIKNWEHRS